MLIEFSGERTGTVMMFGTIAKQLLKMMGQSSNDEGAIRDSDVPAALQKLKGALESVPTKESDNPDTDDDDNEVSIHTRAVPLLKLLEECIEEKSYVMWKPQ